jgi:transketolase
MADRTMSSAERRRLENIARDLRIASLEMIASAGSGHPGPALSIADVIAVLYYRVLDVSAATQDAQSRDRFVLSKGHGCAALYAALIDKGFVPSDEGSKFRSHGGILQGHPRASIPGVEATTGPLGIGASVAVGMAVAQAAGRRVVALLGDGELQAGIVWEAAMFAAHRGLRNLTYIIDVNGLQYTGATADVVNLEPLADKWAAFGWEVFEVDGHDVVALVRLLEQPLGRVPRVLLARTVKGKGVSFMENALEWHGKAPDENQLRAAIAELR